VRETLRSFQATTEPGAVVFARIGLPFHLDFERNPVYTLHATALAAPWVRIPAGNPGELLRWLRRAGVRYVLWQAHGPGVRPRELLALEMAQSSDAFAGPARFNLALYDSLSALARELPREVAHGPFVLLDLERAGDPEPNAGAEPQSSSR
jgi:hypothetical protein